MAIVKVKGIEVELGGEILVVPPLPLGALEQLQDRLSVFKGDIRDKDQVATVIDAAHSALKRNYPDLTREDVANLIDVGNMADVFEAVMDVSGIKRKEIESGEVGKPAK